MNGWCTGNPAHPEHGCGNASTFVARHIDSTESMEACGKHIAAQLSAYPLDAGQSPAFLVVPINPNMKG